MLQVDHRLGGVTLTGKPARELVGVGVGKRLVVVTVLAVKHRK